MAEPLVTHVLYLAPTRPSMKWGVPTEGWLANFALSYGLGMATARMGILYLLASWALFLPIHFGMRVLANKNPGFFREARMGFKTRAAIMGGTLYAMPPRWQRGVQRATAVDA